MKLFVVFFSCCCINLSILFINGAPLMVSNIELSSLLLIKNNLIDPLNHLQDWKNPSNGSYCNWNGVVCNSNGFVEKLDLWNMNLSGRVSEAFGALSSLSVLNLSCNDFSSSLPKSLANLTSLQHFDVSQNNFIGTFPWGLGMASGLLSINGSTNNFQGPIPEDIGNAILLETLDLRGSYFESTIPKSFKNLQKLRFLGLSGNNLTGEIPRELGELSSIETIILGYNQFEGSIPKEFGNLSRLQYLDLAVGTLSGPIPRELGKLKNLQTIYLYQNSFQGKIPPEIGNITSLLYLDLSDNQFSGEIPEEIGNLKNLQLLNLMINLLTGSVPDTISDLTELRDLELWNNSLSGRLPANLGKSSPLEWLDVSSNSFSGEIPSGLCNSGNLTKLILFNNFFSGSIPVSLSNCSSLVRVRIQNNSISGTIPIGFGHLPNLQRLELANNNLTGKIPNNFSMSKSLSFIDFSSNRLKSSLPSTILSLPNLQTFLASENNFDSMIPDNFQSCSSLSILDLSSNLISGKIPQSVASCEKLVNLNLSNNKLTGEIPNVVAAMTMLSVLDLSHNSLNGHIPDNLGTSPALEMLNLSYNELVGSVPRTGILTTTDLIGNTGLCGGILKPCTTATPHGKGKARIKHIIIGFFVGISVIIVIFVAALTASRLYKRCYLLQDYSQWPWRLVAFQRLNFTTSDILLSLNESNVIGIGGSGIVYKAGNIAVKKVWKSEEDIDLFEEVNLLGKLRHRNIVRLVGYLYNESDILMLYEYMPNGNLCTALHGNEAGKLLLDWVSRYNIALGVAHGLAYLHHDCQPPIIHRDVKSNNILLDEHFEARIADFGLARMMLHKNQTVSVVAGSYGYIAPEYGYTLKVDEKIDIYSFGVVLLELLTGKMPVDTSFEESIDIVEWVRRKVKIKASSEALDEGIACQCRHIHEEMLLVLKIALLCTSKLPKDRPSMRDVISMLGEAKPRRKSICQNWRYSPNKEKLIFAHSPIIGLL